MSVPTINAPPESSAPRYRFSLGRLVLILGALIVLAHYVAPDDNSATVDRSTNAATGNSYTMTATTDSSDVSASNSRIAKMPSTHGAKSKDRREARPKEDNQQTLNYMTMTDDVPACPSEAEIKTLMSSASDKSAWPQALEIGEEEGCIALSKGQHVFPLDTEMWSALIQVRPEGSPYTYWTDMLAVK